MSNITNSSPVVTEDKLKDFYEDIKPFLGCPAYITQEGDEMYFSSEEKVVGRWVDGKPVYQKVYSGNYSVSETIKIFDDVVVPNADTLIDVKFIQYDGVVGDSYITTAKQAGIEQHYKLRASSSGGLNPTKIIVQYTKTTDSASTTIEQKPTHYSTDEQVVGTWIDGKPIYQRTFEVNVSLPSQAGAMAHFDASGLENIDTLVSSKQLGYDPSYRVSQEFHCRCDYIKNSSYPNGHIRLAVNTSETGGDLKYLTLQYTKTTDN